MNPLDHFITLSTFFIFILMGVEYGIFVGILLNWLVQKSIPFFDGRLSKLSKEEKTPLLAAV